MTTVPPSHQVLFLIIDGLGDVDIPALGGLSPLELAHTPVLDAVASAGLTGLMDPVEPGLACGSDTAHLSLLGYEPRAYYRGRHGLDSGTQGAFESMGAGLHMDPGDIAFKSNFATYDPESNMVLRRRADRRFEHLGPTLCEYLDGLRLPSFPQHSVSVKYATEHRCGVVLRGPSLSDSLSGTDPLKDNLALLRAEAIEDTEEAHLTARIVNELSREIHAALEAHPINEERRAQGLPVANLVLLRGPGGRIKVESFEERHGLRACIVAPTKIIMGLGISLGIESIEVPGTTGDYYTDFHAKARGAAEALLGPPAAAERTDPGGVASRRDMLLLHVKAVDDAAHDKNVPLRILLLECVDRMLGQLLRRLWEAEMAGTPDGPRFSLVVLGDHSTPVLFGDHSHEPVPFAAAFLSDVARCYGADRLASFPLEPIPTPATDAPLPQRILERAAAAARASTSSGGGAASSELQPGSRLDSARAATGSDAEGFPGEEPGSAAGGWDGSRVFSEREFGAKGSLGRFPGSQVMEIVKGLAWGVVGGLGIEAGAAAAGAAGALQLGPRLGTGHAHIRTPCT